MKCPHCGKEMYTGYLTVDETWVNFVTGFKWYDEKPPVITRGGESLIPLGWPGRVAAFRCAECRAVFFNY